MSDFFKKTSESSPWLAKLCQNDKQPGVLRKSQPGVLRKPPTRMFVTPPTRMFAPPTTNPDVCTTTNPDVSVFLPNSDVSVSLPNPDVLVFYQTRMFQCFFTKSGCLAFFYQTRYCVVCHKPGTVVPVTTRYCGVCHSAVQWCQ